MEDHAVEILWMDKGQLVSELRCEVVPLRVNRGQWRIAALH